uniref:Arrestin domain-containing protein 3-like n=2 Tax=Takifugu rubripes TaxID=31033 RepID=A0A3B5JZ55_TAKRU
MKMTVKRFSLEYDAVNGKNVFTNGDTVNGRIILQFSKDSKVRALVLFATGGARVEWHVDEEAFCLNEKYYNIKHYILQESREDVPVVIGKGRHVFPFSFKFPDRTISTSFKFEHGRALHELRVQLKQPKTRSRWITTVINFVSKPNVNIPRLMEPQDVSQVKTFRFGSGSVRMNVYLEHKAYKQGEALRVTLRVNNLSSRILRPRFVLCSKLVVYAQINEPHKILTERSSVVKPYRMETVTKVFSIPDNLTPSNLNCSLVKLEYWMKVYLDTPFAKSPTVKLPIVLLPSFDVPTTERSPASAAAALETFESRFQTQRIVQQASPLPEEPPPAYEACVVDPTGPPAYSC